VPGRDFAEEATAVVSDYDFRFGRNHLRGKGWRGLAALAIVLMLRAMMLAAVAVLAKLDGFWLVQLLQHSVWLAP
jgi:hypothetical protein